MSLLHECFFVATVAAAHLMIQAALGLALAPIDVIGQDMRTSNPGELSWFIAAYSLTVGTFILIFGRAGDIFGHKQVYALGYVWLSTWSALAGFAGYTHNQIFFDITRAMQGIGCAALYPTGIALFGRTYPPGMRKNIVFSIFGAMAPIGFVIGATFGSIFGQLLWWPWAFWGYAIAALGLACAVVVIVPKELGIVPPNRGFDTMGALTSVIGMILINVAFNNGPLYGWSTPNVYFILIIGVLFLFFFGWVEARAENPLIPKSAINSTTIFILSLLTLGWGSFGIWVYYTWRFLTLLRHQTPLSISAEFAPVVVATLFASGLTGFLLSHTPVSFVMVLSCLGFFLGNLLVALMPVNQVYWTQTFLSIVIMPFGMDMSFPASSVILSNHMPMEHQGLAAALVTTVMNYSISITLGFAALAEVNGDRGPDGQLDLFQGFRDAYYVGVGCAGLAVFLSIIFFIKSMIKEGWKVTEASH
ncbi:hypothetical protein IWZ00DRAFT_440352 [Phyllosticta capitalensis]|uniref:Major facilitator superfamily (MFS) profile domain-containing protein n=1 Tax=Phyllosticta capitalensis TaxID=121624 RepID=A0ABR1YKQ2_9PEZI